MTFMGWEFAYLTVLTSEVVQNWWYLSVPLSRLCACVSKNESNRLSVRIMLVVMKSMSLLFSMSVRLQNLREAMNHLFQ